MAGITKKQISARRQRLLDELPNHGWDYVKAGIAVGYSPSYAKARLKKYAMNDSTFCQQVTVKRCEIEAKSEDRREKRLRQLDTIIDDPNTKPMTKLKAIDLQSKICGWHSNTLTLETGKRQNELDNAYEKEVQRFALLRHNTLPACDVTVYDTQDGEAERDRLDTNASQLNVDNADARGPIAPNDSSLAGSPVVSEKFLEKFSGVKNAKEGNYV